MSQEADADIPKKQRFNGNHCGKTAMLGFLDRIWKRSVMSKEVLAMLVAYTDILGSLDRK